MSRPGIPVRLFVTCWVVYSMHFATNIAREYYPAFSLAERGTLRVDPYLGLHPDLFDLPGRGAFMNNNPGTSIVAALPYAIVRPLIDVVVDRVAERRAASGGDLTADYDTQYEKRREFFAQIRERGLDIRFGLASAAIQVGFTAPVSALGVVVMRQLLVRLGFAALPSLWLALLYGFGTPIFFRTGFINQNLAVAQLSLFAFALLWCPRGAVPSARALFSAGLLAGYTIVCDYSGIVPIGVLGGYALFALWRARGWVALRSIAPMLFGGALSASVLLVYQGWAFGHPLFPAQRYMPDTHLSVEGWNGLNWPALDLFAQNWFSPSFGLFVAAPLLLLAAGAPFARPPHRLERPERVLALAMLLSMTLFASSIEFARLQWNTGVRYLIPTVPFLFLAAASVLMSLPRRWALGIAGLAVFHSWCLAMVREDPFESVALILGGGLRLPWMTVLGQMGDQYVGALADRPVIPTIVIGVIGAALAALWWPLRSSPVWRDERT